MNIKLAPSLLILAGALAAPSIQAEDRQPVTVGDFAVKPMGNLGGNSAWDIHPKALVGIGYDSNLLATDSNEEDDTYFRGIGGITTRWYGSRTLTVTGDAEFETKQHFDSKNDGSDFEGGKLSLSFEKVGVESILSGYATWTRAEDPTVTDGESLALSTFDIGASYNVQSLVSYYTISGSVVDKTHLEDGVTFVAESKDKTVFTVDGVYGRSINAGESWFVRVNAEHSNFEVDNGRDSNALGVTGGLTMGLGARTALSVQAGVKNRWYDRESATGADDDNVFGPFAEGTIDYSWEEGSSAQLRGYADVVDGDTANGQIELGLELNGRLRLRDRLSAFGGLSYTYEDEQSDLANAEKANVFKVSAGLEYELRDGVAARLIGRHTTNDADNNADDYDRLEAFAEVGFVF